MADLRSDQLREAADALPARFAATADCLRAAAAAIETPDPRLVRRMVLRGIWRRHFPAMRRTAAAKNIAGAWASWRPSPLDDIPDTMAATFARLDRAGFRYIAARQIADDLDEDLHPADCIILHSGRLADLSWA